MIGMPNECRRSQTGSDEEMLALFAEIDTNPDHQYLPSTLKMEPAWELKERTDIAEAALIEFYPPYAPWRPAHAR